MLPYLPALFCSEGFFFCLSFAELVVHGLSRNPIVFGEPSDGHSLSIENKNLPPCLVWQSFRHTNQYTTYLSITSNKDFLLNFEPELIFLTKMCDFSVFMCV